MAYLFGQLLIQVLTGPGIGGNPVDQEHTDRSCHCSH